MKFLKIYKFQDEILIFLKNSRWKFKKILKIQAEILKNS